MRIVASGPMTTIQDPGRPGYQRYGVTPGGAMDRVAARVANRLVGDPYNRAGLEMTLQGASIEFGDDALVCICGAEASPEIAGVALPEWRAIYVREGSKLDVGTLRSGCRSYLAVAGGIDVPLVMASRATDLRAGMGGLGGRPLRAGDRLRVGTPSEEIRHLLAVSAEVSGPLPFALTDRAIDESELGAIYRVGSPVRVIRGAESDRFDASAHQALLSERFEVTPASDRMGYRLRGPLLHAHDHDEVVSRPVATGSVQVPWGGAPILLMVDRQTTGGYPVIADVITADLPRVAQLRPGDPIRFEEVSVEDAQLALREQEHSLEHLLRKATDAVD